MRDNLLRKDFTSLLSGALTIFPDLREIRWEHFWGGKLGITTDTLPHIHELSPRVFAGLGFNGRGVALGVMMGRVLAEILLDRNRNELDLPITSPKNFPFYECRKLGFHLASSWYGLMDRIDIMRG